MNLLDPVSTIMTRDLKTVNPEESLHEVHKIFQQNRIHHLPVVRFRKLVGLISKTDLLFFLKGIEKKDPAGDPFNQMRLKHYVAEDIMTTGLAKLESSDRINVALEVFRENLFHAIPIVDNEELVGIVTTYDIIDELSRQAV